MKKVILNSHIILNIYAITIGKLIGLLLLLGSILTIFNLMLIYHISFNIQLFNNYSNVLSSIIKMNHQSYLLICNYLSNKVSSSELENIWVKMTKKTEKVSY